MSSYVPPGWPAEVLPPGAPDWEQSAQAWLLDQCPPEYRGHPVLRRHPLVLAWLARRHAEASWRAMAAALGSARADLAGVVDIGVVEATIGAVEKEQARLVATGRVDGLALMVAQARDDLRVYRETFPVWVSDSTDRGLLNWVHDRLWAHAGRIFDEVSEVHLVARPPLRELGVGLRYRLRVKKHDIEGNVSTYPTQGALDFLEQEQLHLEGMEEVRLIAGYRWDPELRQVGAGVISLRDGLEKPIWTYELTEPATGAVVSVIPMLSPAEPTAPEIGLTSDDKRAEGTEGQ